MSEPSNILEANEKITQALIIRKTIGALAAVNEAYLRKHPECPKLYESDVVYDDSVTVREEYRAIPALLGAGGGNAIELVAWRIAELDLEGRPATVRVSWANRIFQPVVRRQDGSLEGPVAIIREKHS
jgi:hypothetical protein